jgi:hypothetical protein
MKLSFHQGIYLTVWIVTVGIGISRGYSCAQRNSRVLYLSTSVTLDPYLMIADPRKPKDERFVM